MTIKGFNYNDLGWGKDVATMVQDMHDLRALGANCVRWQLIQIDCFNGQPVTEQVYRDWLNLVTVRLREVLQSWPDGLRIIIDVHTPYGWVENNNHLLFTSSGHESVYFELLGVLVRDFAGYDQVLGFDPMNEPVTTGMRNWNALAPKLVKVIKQNSKKRVYLMMHTWDSPDMHKGFKFLGNDRIIYQAHIYQPRAITMQGLHGNPIEPDRNYSKAKTVKVLQPIIDFQAKYKCKIILGEFNATRSSGYPKHNNQLKYCKAVIEIATANKWGWLIHSWREADVWSLEHAFEAHGQNSGRQADNEKLQMLRRAFE